MSPCIHQATLVKALITKNMVTFVSKLIPTPDTMGTKEIKSVLQYTTLTWLLI